MANTKFFVSCFVGFVIFVAATAIWSDSWLTPKELVLGDQNTGFVYKRMLNGAQDTNGFPAVGIGTSLPVATFNSTVVSRVNGHVSSGLRNVVATYNTTGASQTITLDCSRGNQFYVGVNDTGTTIQATKLGNVARIITVYLRYRGTPSIATFNFNEVGIFSIKWPGGDPPVYTLTSGKVDIVSLFWTGSWPGIYPNGQLYGVTTFNY